MLACICQLFICFFCFLSSRSTNVIQRFSDCSCKTFCSATNVVIATEIDPPANQIPLEWILLTNVSIETAIKGYEVVKWYLCRWQIEIYFRILKSGCKIEKLQLETKSRFDACLTIYMIIAWRILYLTMLAREYSDINCDIVFTEE